METMPMDLLTNHYQAPQKVRNPKRSVKRHQLRQVIAQRILSGEVAPGRKLVQASLAQEFSVSLSSLREALLELQAFGLVETDDHRGMFARVWNGQTLLELYDVREGLEGIAARRACERITPTEIEELHELARQIYQHALDGRHDLWPAIDRQLHERITELSGNRTLVLLGQQHWILGKIARTCTDPEHLRAVHEKLVAAIASGDPEIAEAEARRHVATGRAQLAARLARNESIDWIKPPEEVSQPEKSFA